MHRLISDSLYNIHVLNNFILSIPRNDDNFTRAKSEGVCTGVGRRYPTGVLCTGPCDWAGGCRDSTRSTAFVENYAGILLIIRSCLQSRAMMPILHLGWC